MRIAYYIKKDSLNSDAKVKSLLDELRGSFDVYSVRKQSDILPSTSVLLSIGGDGTFLTAARIAAPCGIPVLGVNFGRLGFLSENQPEDIVPALRDGRYSIEERSMLCASLEKSGSSGLPYALNEVCVSRKSMVMLGVDVEIDGAALPTYWADGLLVATSSGSTAYSLSVGGPICAPQSSVLIVAPVSPHNLNVRPLIVPDSSTMTISFRSREPELVFSMDDCIYSIPSTERISVCAAPVRLKLVKLRGNGFVDALRSRLLWGQDVRNINEN